jgi:hypothetical protein
MARIKKAQAGADTSKKVYSASFKYAIGDSVAMKKKIAEDSTARKKKTDSLGLSTSRAQDLLKARMAAKKQRDGGKTAAWQRKEGKNPEGGLNAKGVASYRAANPGSKLKTAVTTKPSKLKKGSKAAGRRKSFCSRMSGMKKKLTSAKTANDPNSRINKSLRKWNC